MRLKRLLLENFRGFEKLDLDLDRDVTVLIGGNASGKSTIVEAIARIAARIANRRINQLFGERCDVRSGSTSATGKLSFTHAGRNAVTTCDVDSYGLNQTQQDEVTLSPIPLGVYYAATRRIRTVRVRPPRSNGRLIGPTEHSHLIVLETDQGNLPVEAALATEGVDLSDFFQWFREREDIENQEARRAGHGRPAAYADRELEAVRAAIAVALPAVSGLTADRLEQAFQVEKDSKTLDFNVLSGGEKHLLAMFGDIARRLAIANPTLPNPLEGEIVILIDEVELHLHPVWQRKVVDALRRAFPNSQLILTTHSPAVLGEVEAKSVVALKDFKPYRTGPTMGRDLNAIVTEIMGGEERSREAREKLAKISDLIDREDLSGARRALSELEEKLTAEDSEVTRLRTMIRFLEVPDEAHSEGK